MKYVSDGSGTWHNTKGHLFNSYLNDKNFTSPAEVMTKYTDVDKYEFGEDHLKFFSNGDTIKNEFLAAIEPFASNGITMIQAKGDKGWEGNVSSGISHAMRHGVKGKKVNGNDVEMDEIVIHYDKKTKSWMANDNILEYSRFWDGNDKNKTYRLSSIEVSEQIIAPLGKMTMQYVVEDHISRLKKNPKYINMVFMAMLTKITAKSLESKLPDYLIAYRTKSNSIKFIDCSLFKNSTIMDAELKESKVRDTNDKDISDLISVGKSANKDKTMGYTISSKSLGVSFKLQYYWKNGTGLSNPVIIGFIDF